MNQDKINEYNLLNKIEMEILEVQKDEESLLNENKFHKNKIAKDIEMAFNEVKLDEIQKKYKKQPFFKKIFKFLFS